MAQLLRGGVGVFYQGTTNGTYSTLIGLDSTSGRCPVSNPPGPMYYFNPTTSYGDPGWNYVSISGYSGSGITICLSIADASNKDVDSWLYAVDVGDEVSLTYSASLYRRFQITAINDQQWNFFGFTGTVTSSIGSGPFAPDAWLTVGLPGGSASVPAGGFIDFTDRPTSERQVLTHAAAQNSWDDKSRSMAVVYSRLGFGIS